MAHPFDSPTALPQSDSKRSKLFSVFQSPHFLFPLIAIGIVVRILLILRSGNEVEGVLGGGSDAPAYVLLGEALSKGKVRWAAHRAAGAALPIAAGRTEAGVWRAGAANHAVYSASGGRAHRLGLFEDGGAPVGRGGKITGIHRSDLRAHADLFHHANHHGNVHGIFRFAVNIFLLRYAFRWWIPC